MGKSTKRGILPTNAGRKYDGIDSNGKLWVNGGQVRLIPYIPEVQ